MKNTKITPKLYSIILSLAICFLFPHFAGAADVQGITGIIPQASAESQQSASDEISRISELKATVTKTVGTVTVRTRGAIFWHDAKPGEFLKAGDEIVTKETGKIEFALQNGNILKLKPN